MKVTFVNRIMGRGIMNSVVNVTLGVFQFTPDPENNTVNPDLVAVESLRMDIPCAMALRDHLTELLASIEKKPDDEAMRPGTAGIDAAEASGKPN